MRRLAIRLGEPPPEIEGNMVSRWERGSHEPGPRYVRLLTLIFDRRPGELGLRDPELEASGERAAETTALLDAARVSDFDPTALDGVDGVVDRLCRAYSTQAPAALLPRVQQRLWQLQHHLASRLTMTQHRRLLEASGWLHLLLAALHYDLSEREPADGTRDLALHLGTETGHLEIQGWAFETSAYFNLAERAREAADLAEAGRGVAPLGTHAAAAVTIQEARAWARLHDRPRAEEALLRAAKVIEVLPPVDNPQHHFRFDAAKFLHYAHTAYAWLGMPDHTERYARQAIVAFGDPAGRNHWPSRVTTARLDLAVALAQRGSLDEAVATGVDALAGASWMRRFQLDKADDVAAALRGAPAGGRQEYEERLALAKRASGERARVDW